MNNLENEQGNFNWKILDVNNHKRNIECVSAFL